MRYHRNLKRIPYNSTVHFICINKKYRFRSPSRSLVSETVHKKDIPDAMNCNFYSVGKDLADKISPVPHPLLSGDFEMIKTKAIFHFRTIEVHEIRDADAKIKTAKNFGIDNISSYFLKLALPFIENSLAFMFNTSLTSVFRDSWKIAKGYSQLQKMDVGLISQTLAQYLTPVISRLFEKLATNQVYQHMEGNSLFSSGQSANLRIHSTVTHLLQNTDDWYNGLDLGRLVGLVFIDL